MVKVVTHTCTLVWGKCWEGDDGGCEGEKELHMALLDGSEV